MFERELLRLKSYIEDLDKRIAYTSPSNVRTLSYRKYAASELMNRLLDEESSLPVYIPDRMPYSSKEIVDIYLGELRSLSDVARGEEAKELFYYLVLGIEQIQRLFDGENVTEETYICQDVFSGRYFRSNLNRIQDALEQTNYILANNGKVALNTYYAYIGLPGIKIGYNYDWTYPDCEELQLDYTTGMSEDGRHCLFVDFCRYPNQNYEPWGV